MPTVFRGEGRSATRRADERLWHEIAVLDATKIHTHQVIPLADRVRLRFDARERDDGDMIGYLIKDFFGFALRRALELGPYRFSLCLVGDRNS